MPLTSPGLWIVATPIGNIDDFSPRARKTLENADIILAEDTRRAARLLHDCGIKARRVESFFDHNEEKKLPSILDAIKNGASVALISDAGTPLLADPGYRLARACRRECLPVSPVPGPSAIMAALCAAGIPPLPFTFLGFLPRTKKARVDLFSKFSNTPATLVFFERKDRLAASLEDALAALGNRELAICRELTKQYEEIIHGELARFNEYCDGLLGELTIIVGPPAQAPRSDISEVRQTLAEEMAKGLKPRQAAVAAMKKCQGWTGGEIYNLLNNSG